MLTPEQLAEWREKVERDYLCWRNPDVRQLFEHIDAQQARIVELEQDAARYRWLRKKAYVGECYTERGKVYEIAGMDIEVKLVEVRGGDDSDEVDAAIDAAMQK